MTEEPKNRRTKQPKLTLLRYSVLSTPYRVRQVLKSLLFIPVSTVIIVSPLFAQSPEHAAPPASGPDIPTMLFVFMLATFIGMGVITRVSRLLHTPLMSITNAISAIAVVGAIAVAGAKHPFYINLLGAIALFASTTNIVSGFLITDRMLKMFKKQEPTKS
jgi:NAD(P) transhydrogenase subunit alpha